MARSVDRVRDFLSQHGLDVTVQELPGSTRTAALAAQAVGAELGQIVKSLVFIDERDRTLLVLVAGDRRADPNKIAAAVASSSARIANAEEVRARTGYAIGGVPPVAHTPGVLAATLMDSSLSRFERVWAAAGAPNAVFPIERARLDELTGAAVADVTAVV